MILLHSDESAAPDFAPGSPEFDEMMGEWMAFNADLAEGNHLLGGASLAPTMTATTLHKSPEGNSTTDGPYAETKEQLGGFYILECETLDDAIQWAAKIPHASSGTVEVRPVPDFGQD